MSRASVMPVPQQARTGTPVHRRLARGLVRILPLPVVAVTLVGCGSLGNYVARPALTVEGTSTDAHQAINQMFASGRPYALALCEADLHSHQCKNGAGLSASGVGGPVLPLFLNVSGMQVTQQHEVTDGLALGGVKVAATVDGIPPACATAQGTITSASGSTASLKIDRFYCNWMGIGNVLTSVDLSIDNINLADRAFTGYYRLQFYGTGNATGSGYYKAVISPRTT